MSRTKLDPIHIQQYVFDEDTESYKVKMLPMEMSIELDANDGDSIITHPKSDSTKEKNKPINCQGMGHYCLYNTKGSLKLEVSPSLNDDVWFEILSIIGQNMVSGTVCAIRIRMTGDGEGSYLVVRA